MKVHQTRNYSLFTTDITNRPIDTRRAIASQKKIRKSMEKYGFLPFPLLVKRTGDKLKVLDGQNRLAVATSLALPVFYVETEREDIIIADCAAGQSPWNVNDYVGSFAKQGNREMQTLLAFATEHKLPVARAASLLVGDSAHSGNVQKQIKEGKFRVRDLEYAHRVARMVSVVAQFAPWARSANAAGAISRFVRVAEFSDERMIRAVKSHPHLLRNYPDIEGLSEMFEAVYNHASRSPIPLAFRAKEEAKKRADFAGRSRAS